MSILEYWLAREDDCTHILKRFVWPNTVKCEANYNNAVFCIIYCMSALSQNIECTDSIIVVSYQDRIYTRAHTCTHTISPLKHTHHTHHTVQHLMHLLGKVEPLQVVRMDGLLPRLPQNNAELSQNLCFQISKS